MNIQNSPSSQSFGCKLPTMAVLESTTGRMFKQVSPSDRVNLIKNVLKMEKRDINDLNRDPLCGFLCLISSGKILLDKNPMLQKPVNKLLDIMKIDKTGETTAAVAKSIVQKLGKEIDLNV